MLREHHNSVIKLSIIADIFVLACAFLLSHFVRSIAGPFEPLEAYLWLLPFLLVVWVFLLNSFGMYESFRTKNNAYVVYIILKSGFFVLIILACLIYFFKLPHYVSRAFILLIYINSMLLLYAEKSMALFMLRFLRKKGYNYRNILLVGTNKRAERFMEIVSKNPEWGLRIIGIVEHDQVKVGQEFQGVKIIGTFKDLPDIIHKNVVDEVMFLIPRSWLDKVQDMIILCETEGITASIAIDFFDMNFAKLRQSDFGGFPLLSFKSTSDKLWQLFIKRVIDVGFSLVALILLSPVFVFVAIVIKASSRGPVFFTQQRCGLSGRKFKLYKFRTMIAGAEKKIDELRRLNEMQGPVFKIKNDPRVTDFGNFLRKFSVDEFPQLWNVLKGDMSLVGPRPPIPAEVEKYDNWQRRRLSMRPGLTCLWQIKGRNRITDFNEWMRLDLEYIDNWSLWLDFEILARTIPVVVFCIGAR